MSDIWNEEDDKTLDELLEIFEKEDNQETETVAENTTVETIQEQEENTKEENTNETEQKADDTQSNNDVVDNSKDIELEKLRQELERMRAENERIKAIEEENARIKMIAEEKGVDISKSVYDITEDDIKALEEDYPDQARIMRGLYRQLQNNAKSDNNVSQNETTPTVEQPTQQDNVRGVIDKYTPELALWLDHQDKYGNEWKTACSIDTKLQNSPEWSNRPIGERFQEVLRLTKEQLFNTERTKANETVSRTELQSPTSPSEIGGSSVNNMDNFARISNMSDEDFLTGNLSAKDIQEIYKQCF